MGLGTKQFSGDQTPMESGSPELSKPPPTRRQQPLQEPLKCPRCSSTNTKFCYYNNYNKSQPRHFCKSCKRHWTYGGTLRNVPVGGVRKHKMPNTKTNSNTTAVTIDPTTTVAIGDRKSMSSYQALSRFSSPFLTTKKEGISDDIIPKIEFPISSYQALTRSSSPLLATKKEGINDDMIPKIEFPIFSSLSGNFDADSYLVPTSYDQSYNTLCDHYVEKVDSMEGSIITNIDIPTSSGTLPPWCGPDTDIPTNGCNWNDIDFLNQWI